MARKYSRKASSDVERVMKKRKAGTLRSGRSKKKVKSRKQAIAIGLSEARAKGRKVPKKASKKTAKTRKTSKKRKSSKKK
ncbi:topoisomerase IA-like protein [Bradyrhizobium sp. USDA 4011]